MLPTPPNIVEEELQRCKDIGDYCPILFEWYKFAGGLCVFFSCLDRGSPALRVIPENEYTILVGLLNRCARLMLANVALSHEGKFGETTAIVDRCISESSVILSWLCRTSGSDRFTRYIANGLKAELELKEQISRNVSMREGAMMVIEKRMLESIERCIRDSGLTEQEIAMSKKLPDLASMITATRKSRLMYTVAQRIGSHHVHGTWVSLHMHYLDRDELGNVRPRDHNCSTHVNQYVYVPVVVLDALSAFVSYVVPEAGERKEIIDLLESTEGEILKINEYVVGNDSSLL